MKRYVDQRKRIYLYIYLCNMYTYTHYARFKCIHTIIFLGIRERIKKKLLPKNVIWRQVGYIGMMIISFCRALVNSMYLRQIITIAMCSLPPPLTPYKIYLVTFFHFLPFYSFFVVAFVILKKIIMRIRLNPHMYIYTYIQMMSCFGLKC